jgi:hypothetical protein
MAETAKVPELTASQKAAQAKKQKTPAPEAEKKAAPEKGIELHVTASVKAVRKELSVAQRASSHFSEAPMVAGKVLRRGTTVKLSEQQASRLQRKLMMLHKAHAIDISIVYPDGRKVSMDDERWPHFKMLPPNSRARRSMELDAVVETAKKVTEEPPKEVEDPKDLRQPDPDPASVTPPAGDPSEPSTTASTASTEPLSPASEPPTGAASEAPNPAQTGSEPAEKKE